MKRSPLMWQRMGGSGWNTSVCWTTASAPHSAKWARLQRQRLSHSHYSRAFQFETSRSSKMHIYMISLNQLWVLAHIIDGLLISSDVEPKALLLLPELLGASPTKAVNDTALKESMSLCPFFCRGRTIKRQKHLLFKPSIQSKFNLTLKAIFCSLLG